MIEISRLRSNPVSIMVVLGLFYFGVLAYVTTAYVALGLKGHLTLYLLMTLLACLYSVRMLWTWLGLIASATVLGFRGLYVADGRVAYVSPRVRSVGVDEIAGVRAAEVRMGPLSHRFVEFELRGGGRWRIPGFILAQSTEAAAARAQAALAAR